MNPTGESLLKSKIIVHGYNSLTDFCLKTRILGKNAFYKKLQNPDSFKLGEIKKFKELLNLSEKDINVIFFED